MDIGTNSFDEFQTILLNKPKIMKHIVRIILLSMFSMLFMFSNAQEDVKLTKKEQRKAEKAKKKKEMEDKEAADWLVYQKLAQNQQYVIEFDKFSNPRTGEQYVLSRRLNFLYAKVDRIIIQIETSTYLSENGLGGRTINGVISNYKYKPPKSDKKPIFINFDVTTKLSARKINVSITINKGGMATLSFGSGPNIYGIFIPVNEANINVGVDMWK